MYALTAIRGIGRRFSNICCKKAEIDLRKRYVADILFVIGHRGPVCPSGLVPVSIYLYTAYAVSLAFVPFLTDLFFSCSAGELSAEELEAVMNIVADPRAYKIPDWFLNRQKDVKDGKYSQLTSSQVDTKLREDLERLKKIRNHRGLRHYWGFSVRGQHTKTTGRAGKTVGVAKKK